MGEIKLYENIPEQLKALNQWVVHKGKRPYQPNGSDAKAGQPDTWTNFERAVRAQESGSFDGIGFQFATGGGLVGVDLDTMRDPTTGVVDPLAEEIIKRLDSYTEISPSGYGFHIIAKADVALQWNKKKLESNEIQRVDIDPKTGEARCDKDGNPRMKRPEIEMYSEGRYFTMTGNVYEGHMQINERADAVQELHNRWVKLPAGEEQTVQNKGSRRHTPTAAPVYVPNIGTKDFLADALKRGKDQKLMELWNGERPNGNESADDQGLMNKLAYWCNCDEEHMIDAFLQSPHFNSKDAEHKKKCNRVDYLPRTAKEAISKCTQTAENNDWNYRQTRKQQAGQEFAILIGGNGLEMLDQLHPDTNPRYRNGDIGNGALFADVFKDQARCVFETKQWYVYDGKRWVKDAQKLKVMELCKQLAKALILYATRLPEDENSKKYFESVTKWRSLSKRKTIIEDAASVWTVCMSEFDSDPYLFNCENGTLNLKNGEFYSHRASDMLTMIAGVSYDPKARCSRWDRFILEIMQGDEEKALFLQKALGYSLTGDTTLECFFILYGATTRNGKGTTMETFKRLTGDYGAAASPETIAQKKNRDSNAPSEAVARLAGKRFVNLSEPDQNMVLSSATVKTMTGNDTINARFLHENSFEFVPQFKLFINTNYLPRVTDPTVFSSGRVKVIPFERHFEPDEQDKSLKQTLMQPDSLSGILNWCIEGLNRVREEGLDPPASVEAATSEYRKSNDKMALFFADRMDADPQGEVVMGILYTAYSSWCSKNGYMVVARNKFNSEVERYCGSNGTIKRKRPKGCSRDTNPLSVLIGYNLLPDMTDYFPQ